MSELTHGEFDQRPDGWNMVDLTPPTPGVLTRHTFYVDYGEGDRTDEFYQADEANDALTTLRATIEQQAQELGRCKSEKNDAVIELYRKLDAKDAELAASQARCRVLEKGFADQTAIRERHEAGFRETIAQLQATLTARDAELQAMTESVEFLGATKEPDGSLRVNMKKYHAVYRCEDHRGDPWRGIDTEQSCFVCLKQERDAAVQEAGRLREAALWAMNKVKRLSTRAVDYKRAEEFIEYERALKGA